MSTDPTDDLIEALVVARERGLSRVECQGILQSVYEAPWSDDDEYSRALAWAFGWLESNYHRDLQTIEKVQPCEA